MKEHKLSDLIVDYTIYPRNEVDRHHVSVIQLAIEGGAEVPPLVIEASTKRIVDGVHRYRAYKRIYGDDNPEAAVTCIEKEYKNDAALFLDAMRYNASHGRSLTRFDRTHCVIMAKQLRVSEKDIAKVLHVPPSEIKRIVADRSAMFDNEGKQTLTPIKGTIKHKAGATLTDEQVTCNKKLGGMDQTFYVNQIILLIENDLLNHDDEELMSKLAVLAKLLNGLLVEVA